MSAGASSTDDRLFSGHRQLEAARIVIVAVLTFMYWRALVPFQC